MAPTSKSPPRAPALYFSTPASSPTPVAFRLPCPPAWDDRRPNVWAAERRARKAYVAALEALATGTVPAEQAVKIQRLAGEVRSVSARLGLEHLLRVLGFVRRHGSAVLPPPEAPLTTVIATVPLPPQGAGEEGLRRRYAWALEWLQTRRYLATRNLSIEWRVDVAASTPGRERGPSSTGSVQRGAARGARRDGRTPDSLQLAG